MTFHIVLGLAGGTGSGSVVDAVAQLRDLYPDSKRYKILLYALLPDAYPNPELGHRQLPRQWVCGPYRT